MAWKDQYLAQHGAQIGIKPSETSEPQSWKERYLRGLEEREERQKLYEEREKKLSDEQKKRDDAYALAQDMRDYAYLQGLDQDKREASGAYQDPFDAEKRRYQYEQKTGEYQQKAADLETYFKENTDKYSMTRSDVLRVLAKEMAGLGDTGNRLTEDAAYWQQFENQDAYDLAMRNQDIENRQREAERRAEVQKRDEAYRTSGETYIPGLGLPINRYAEQQFNRDAEKNTGLNFAYDEPVSMAKLNPQTKNVGIVRAPLAEADDFETLSKLGAELDNSKGIQNKVMYGRENADMLAASAFIGGSSSKESGYYRYRMMDDNQVAIYNYLLVKEGMESAEDYLKTIENEIDAKIMNQFKQGTAEFATENPITASMASVGAAPLAGVGYLSAGIQKLLGKEVDANDSVHGLSAFQNTVRGSVAQDISQKYGDVPAFLYQTGMSIGDNALVMMSTGGSGWFGGALLGMNAAESTMLDAVGRGATEEQALLSGLWAGAAEMVFEKVSIDSFVKMTKAGRGALIKNILKQAGIEGSEETFTEIADAIGDKLIMGDLSNYDLSKQKYIAEGQSEEQAQKNALLDIAKNVGLAAAGGAISGGVFGAGGSAIGAFNQRQNTQSQTPADVETAQEDPLRLAAREMADREAEAQREAMRAQDAQQATIARQAEQTDAAQTTAVNGPENAPAGTQSKRYSFEPNRVVFNDGSEVPARYEMTDAGDITVYLDEGGNSETSILVKQGMPDYGSVYSAYRQESESADAWMNRETERISREGEYTHVRQEYSDKAYTALDEPTRKRFADSFAVMDAMAARAGLDIRIVDRVDAVKNGKTQQSLGNARYNPDENVIDIALDAQDGAYEYIAVHELTHHIKNKSALEYGVLADVVTEALTKNGEDVDALVRAEMERNGYTEEIAREEVIANSIPAILNDEATVRRLVETNRSVAQRIADFIQQLLADIKAVGQKLKNRASWKQMGSLENDVQSLQEISDLFLGALESTAENTTAENGETAVIVNETGNTANENTDNGVRFSIKDIEPDESADALIAENQKLREAVDLLRAEFELTKNNAATKEDIRKLARQIKREYQSDIDYEKLAGQMEELFNYLAQTDKPDWTDVQRVGLAIGTQVIDRSQSVDKTNYEHYADAREKLRTTRITLNEAQKQEAAYIAGTYDGYRKRLFGAVGLVNEGMPLDALWGELSDMNPELFPEDAPDVDMPGYLMDAVEHMRPQYVNPYEMNRQEAANDVLMKVYQAYFELPKVRTFADKQKAKYDAQLDRYRQKMAEYRDEVHQKYTQRLSAIRKEDIRKRQVLAKKIREEKSEQMKAALRKQYRGLSTNFYERLEQNRARYSKWKDYDRAREFALPKIKKNAAEMIEWLARPTDAKHVPERMKNAVTEFLKTLDFAGDKQTIEANKWREKMELLRGVVLEVESGQFDNMQFFMDFDPDLMNTMQEFIENSEGTRKISDLTGAELYALDEMLRGIKKAMTDANKLHTNSHYETVNAAGEASMKENDERRAAKIMESKAGKTIVKLLNFNQLDAIAFAKQIGEGLGSAVRALRKGLDTKTRLIRKTELYVKDLLGKTDIKALDNDVQTFTVTGGKIKLSKLEIMSLYCLNNRKQAVPHIYDGGIRTESMGQSIKVSEGNVAEILGTLSEEDLRIAKGLQQYMETVMSEWGNEVTMTLYGYKKFTEKNYFPIKSDENFIKSMDRGNDQGGLWRLKNLGMTKAVVRNANNPIMVYSIMDVFVQHANDMSSYNAFVVPLSDAMKLINYKNEIGSVKQSLERGVGPEAKKYYLKLIEDINGVNMTGGNEIGSAWLRRAKIAAVGGNARVVVQQPTAYLRAMNMISPRYLVEALAHKPQVAKSKQYCMIAQWKSYGFFDLNVGKGLNEIITGRAGAMDKMRNAALWGAQKADDVTWGYIWNACELETKAKHPEMDVRSNEFNQLVADRMSEVVDNTQVVDSVFHRSQLMRDRRNEFFTTFMSEPTKTYNMVRSAIAEAAIHPGNKVYKAKLERALATYTMTGLLTAAAAALVDAMRDDDDDKEYFDRFGPAFGANAVDILNPLNMIPYMRELVSIYNGYRSSRLEMRGFELTNNALNQAYKAIFESGTKKSAYGIISELAKGASYVTGIPVGNMIRDFESGIEMIAGIKIDKESDTATLTKAYSKLYKAMAEGNTSRAKTLRSTLRSGNSSFTAKNNAEIDKEIAKQLMLNDPRIPKAMEAKRKGNAREVYNIRDTVVRDGFTKEMFDSAVAQLEDRDSTAADREKNMDKELGAMLFSYDDLGNAVIEAAISGDKSDVDLIYSEILADKAGLIDPAGTIKGEITSRVKKAYIEYVENGDSVKRNNLEYFLMVNYDYKVSDFNDWIKAYTKAKAGL